MHHICHSESRNPIPCIKLCRPVGKIQVHLMLKSNRIYTRQPSVDSQIQLNFGRVTEGENITWWNSNNAWSGVFAQQMISKWSIWIVYKIKFIITNLCSSDCIPTFCRRIFLLMSKKATASLSLSVWEYQLTSYSRDLTKVPESVEVCRMPHLHSKSLLYILNSSFLKHANISMATWYHFWISKDFVFRYLQMW